jgi:poly(3-hydroxybutyrate) depolymerase
MTSRAAVPLACLLLLAPGRRAAGAAPAADPALEALVAELRAACEKAKPEERAAAAEAAAGRPGVSPAAWREAARAMRPAVAAPAGERAQTVTLRVLGADEATEVVTYVPPTPREGAAPLILALHGAGGRGTETLPHWRDVADATGAVVVAPSEAGENAGYRFSPRERASAIAALRWARLRFDVDPDRVLVTGASRGGHMSWDLALRRPDLFAAAAPMIGAPRLATQGGQNNLRFLENATRLSIRGLQGAKDDPRAVENVRRAFERLKVLGARDTELVEFPDRAHDYDFRAVDWVRFTGAARRDPDPARVVLRATARGDRIAWVEALELEAGVEDDPRIPQPSGWDRMEETARRKFVEAEVEKRTARLEVLRVAPGRFEAKSKGVSRFRLLLTPEALGESGSVVVTWNGAAVRRKVAPSALVLLRDFVERVDRAFLPVAEVSVP